MLEQSTNAVARFTLGKEDQAILGQVFGLQIGIKYKQPSEGLVIPTDDEVYDILLESPGEKVIELNGEWQKSIISQAGQGNPPLETFFLQAAKVGLGVVNLDYYLHNHWLTKIALPFEVLPRVYGYKS